MGKLIAWVDTRLALAIHERQLAEHGGSSGVRDEKLLESALARPQHVHAYGSPSPDLAELAASLAFGLARHHPFVDGDKRTAAVCCGVFLAINNIELAADDSALYPEYYALAEGKLTEADFAAWLRAHLHLMAGSSVHEKRARYARR